MDYSSLPKAKPIGTSLPPPAADLDQPQSIRALPAGVFFLINLAAAYLPTVLVGLVTMSGGFLFFLFAPVLIIAMQIAMQTESLVLAWIGLISFYAGIALLSATYYQSYLARRVIPALLFGSSLIQALVVATLLASLRGL